jgi:hypothetical protein
MFALCVHVQVIAPLYVHVQVPPEQVAAQVFPLGSWHEYVSVEGPPPPPLPPAEHVAVPRGAGMFGH